MLVLLLFILFFFVYQFMFFYHSVFHLCVGFLKINLFPVLGGVFLQAPVCVCVCVCVCV